MKGIALLLLGILAFHSFQALLILNQGRPQASTPQGRKAILTWDSDEEVNRTNDRIKCELTSP
jgi:hypothetical protein